MGDSKKVNFQTVCKFDAEIYISCCGNKKLSSINNYISISALATEDKSKIVGSIIATTLTFSGGILAPAFPSVLLYPLYTF